MMRGPVWGGPQAAGKRHSQPFCQKRLPHPRGVSQPTKPGTKMARAHAHGTGITRSHQPLIFHACASHCSGKSVRLLRLPLGVARLRWTR